MAFTDSYRRQVELLVRTIPHVAQETCFALKGGTAINLFVRDMPRLSVDIDLTYLPSNDRETALNEIESTLFNIKGRIARTMKAATITASAPATQRQTTKLVVRTPDRTQIKIEVTPVLRGCVYDPALLQVNARVQETFGFAEMNVLSFEDLYAGKIAAALDRQHPRDLFDIHLLLENEGLTEDLRTAFIIYLISHNKPPQHLLTNACRDITHEYKNDFVGMTEDDIAHDRLRDAHADLQRRLLADMPPAHKAFLPGFYRRKPDWALLGVDSAEHLPAVKWREQNLDKAGEGTREEIARALEALFS
ncbi:MAG: nucleotidyl transferase AbiEii/AbiGii toxin family protein [Pseudomonadales bacterium]|nr:nucleotidyl transferase AbiEii/AbiGii toxin family protein [Pseudomonadales bacterium]